MSLSESDSFRTKVERAFAPLIATEHFRVHDETPSPPVNDGAIVVLDNDLLRFRVTRDRGVLDLDVASKQDPERWFSLATFHRALYADEKRIDNSSLESLASEMTAHLQQVSEAVAKDAWPKTRVACEAVVLSNRAAFMAHAKSLETSGYTAKAAEGTRAWRRRWKFKLGFFVAGMIGVLQGLLNDVREFMWIGVALIGVALLISGKHKDEPLPPSAGHE